MISIEYVKSKENIEDPLKTLLFIVRQLLSTFIITINYLKFKDNIAYPLTRGLIRDQVGNMVKINKLIKSFHCGNKT